MEAMLVVLAVMYLVGLPVMWWIVREDYFEDVNCFYSSTANIVYSLVVVLWPISIWFVIMIKATSGKNHE